MGIPAEAEELVVVDMAASTTGEHQNSDEYSVGICAKDSSGPYDLDLRRRLVRLCGAARSPTASTPTRATAPTAAPTCAPAATLRVAVIGPGVDASHAYERTHADSLEPPSAS